MSKRKSKGTYNLENMRSIVADYEDYDGTKKTYCATHELNPHTFDYWRERVRAADARNVTKPTKRKISNSTSNFVELSPTRATLKPTITHYMLHFPDGKRLELPLGVSAELLIELLKIQL
jgi:transposase-like protein|tara:strand:+ start:80 stop:439 length:360 start_codon:yes stop_codon:yes gene_type:complete